MWRKILIYIQAGIQQGFPERAEAILKYIRENGLSIRDFLFLPSGLGLINSYPKEPEAETNKNYLIENSVPIENIFPVPKGVERLFLKPESTVKK